VRGREGGATLTVTLRDVTTNATPTNIHQGEGKGSPTIRVHTAYASVNNVTSGYYSLLLCISSKNLKS